MQSQTVSYKDAALMIGCTHHYVRMLANQGTLEIAERVEVRPNVLKVMLTLDSVERFKEARRRRYVERYRLTREEKRAVDRLLKEMRNG